MDERSCKSWWQRRLPDISAAASRFPLAVAIAAALAIYKLANDFVGDTELRVLGALAASFLWVVSVDLYVESRRRSLTTRIALWLGGVLLIALLFWLAWQIWLSPPLFLISLLLLVGLAAHLGRGESNSAFWLFNHRLWLGALLAAVGAGLLGAGLSVIHATLNLLFGLGLTSQWHDHIWTVSFGLVAPVSFLAFAPRNFTDTITAREERDFSMRAAAALVKFVLVPLLLVYTAILCAYAVKIALAWELPKGTLGAMVVGYLLVGAATLLLGYPSRETGGPLVRLFWRYWVWLTALPVVLLFIAVSRRIADYGLTEERYLIVLIGVWAVLLAAIRVVRGGDFDLRLLPGVLALLLLAASLGLGGAIGLSVMSQKAELASILAAKGMLADGKIVAGPGGENPLGRDAARVRGIEWYLNSHHALGVLAPWFEGRPDNPFAESKTPEQTVREVLAALGLSAAAETGSGLYLTYYSDAPVIVATAGAAHVIGPVVLQSAGADPAPIPPQTIAVEGLGSLNIELADTTLTARLETGGRVEFDIQAAVKEVHNRGWPRIDDHRPLEVKGSGSGLDGTVLFENLNGIYRKPKFEPSLLRFWLVLERAE
jgi:hypothetical protein